MGHEYESLTLTQLAVRENSKQALASDGRVTIAALRREIVEARSKEQERRLIKSSQAHV